MRVLFVVNDALGLEPTQTTTLLIWLMEARGHEVAVASVDGLTLAPGDEIQARAWPVGRAPAPEALPVLLGSGAAVTWPVGRGDVVMMRTNPARDQRRSWAHAAALEIMRAARDQGAFIFNDPDGLARASSKLYLSRLPARHRPETLVSHDPEVLAAFVRGRSGLSVLKPLQGTHGRDVFFVDPSERNLRQIIDVLTRDGMTMAQSFIPEAVDGDTRVLVLDGRLLEADGQAAAVRRIPGVGELRSNVHAGGRASVAVVDEAMRHAVAELGPIFKADGLLLVGLDFIGGKIVEVNAFAPGGLGDASALCGGAPFAETVIDVVERLQRDSQGEG